jgi:hypothetical protein
MLGGFGVLPRFLLLFVFDGSKPAFSLRRPTNAAPRMPPPIGLSFSLLAFLRRLQSGNYPLGHYRELVNESFAKAPLPQLVKNSFDGRGCRGFVFGRCAFWFSPGGSAWPPA